jgi:hypothetical protein
MPAEVDAAGGDQATLRFSDAAGCKAWLEQLPLSDVVECHAELSGQVRQLAQATLKPAAKLELLELLRETVAAVQSGYAQVCWRRPVPLEEGDRAIWESVVGLWRTMASAYDSLIVDMAGAAPELAAQADLISQRALRYTALAMGEYSRVYHAVSAELWKQLHRVYVFAENAGVATKAVHDAVGRVERSTSCAATYVHALLAHFALPDALSVEQMEILDRWLDRWEKLVVLSPEPLLQSTVPALAVDLASPKGMGFAKDMPAAGVRHLNLEGLSKALHQAAESLKQGQTPAQLGLGDMPPEACEKLLLLLHVQWCAAGTGRLDERSLAGVKVMIFPSIPSIHYHLTGRPFRQPAGEITARERRDAEMLESVSERSDLVSQSSAAVETWVIVNKSVSGFLGMCRDPQTVTRISHHQLLGLQAPASKNINLGIVQRLIVDEDGAIWAGLRLLSAAPQAAAVRVTNAKTRDPKAAKYDRALLTPEDAARKVPASVLLPPGWFAAGRVLDLQTDTAQKIRLQALLERGPNFARATYSAG